MISWVTRVNSSDAPLFAMFNNSAKRMDFRRPLIGRQAGNLRFKGTTPLPGSMSHESGSRHQSMLRDLFSVTSMRASFRSQPGWKIGVCPPTPWTSTSARALTSAPLSRRRRVASKKPYSAATGCSAESDQPAAGELGMSASKRAASPGPSCRLKRTDSRRAAERLLRLCCPAISS